MTSQTLAPARRALDGRMVALGLASVLAAVAFVAYTYVTLIAIAGCGAFIALHWLIPARLQLWQAFMAISIAGFIILNYGFENLVLAHIAGVPLLIGEFLMLAGLLLAIRKLGFRQLKPLLRDPIIRCFLFLLAFAVLHLAVDIPRFGLYALRDASMYFEAVFMAAGYLWSTEKNGIRRFVQCLLIILAFNAIYSFSLPFGDSLQSISPRSGVFQPIALFGQYQQVGLYLLAGAILCVWLIEYATTSSRYILFALAIAQICGLAVIQNRSMYLGIVIILVLLFALRERRKFRRFTGLVGRSAIIMIALLFTFSFLGIRIRGRVGEIDADFLRQYALSVLSLDNSNSRLAQDDDRVDWLQEAWQSTASDPVTLLTGQGFGKPLIDFETQDGIPVRQPHNAAMGVFGRLGVIGVSVWLLSQVLLFKRFTTALRARQSREMHDLILWLLMFYVLAFLMSMVQPALEFSHYAVPLYFILGFALKVLETALVPREKTANGRPLWAESRFGSVAP